jgi:ABC-type dipeptide/oligopeptide/nickel transport system ATPase component
MSDRGSPETLLVVDELEVRFPQNEGTGTVVNRVSFQIRSGERFGVIGETGAGKSLTAWAVLGLIPPPAQVNAARVDFDGRPLLGASSEELRAIRGGKIGVIPQNPQSALNPVLDVGRQIANVYRAHTAASRKDGEKKAVDALRMVGIADAARRARAYPHEFSGGMAQRVLIAMALVNGPRLVIADEPTTGLDVTVQAEILDLMSDLVVDTGTAIWLITHDLGVISRYTERAAVMFQGEFVESAPTANLFRSPRHPESRALLRAAGVTIPDQISEVVARRHTSGSDGIVAPGDSRLVEVEPEHFVRRLRSDDDLDSRVGEAGGREQLRTNRSATR